MQSIIVLIQVHKLGTKYIFNIQGSSDHILLPIFNIKLMPIHIKKKSIHLLILQF